MVLYIFGLCRDRVDGARRLALALRMGDGCDLPPTWAMCHDLSLSLVVGQLNAEGQ